MEGSIVLGLLFLFVSACLLNPKNKLNLFNPFSTVLILFIPFTGYHVGSKGITILVFQQKDLSTGVMELSR